VVHQYKNNGYNIVLDVNSGCVHVVDDMVYDIIEAYKNDNIEETKASLVEKYGEKEVAEGIEEVETLKADGALFTEDVYKDYIIDFKKRQTVVKALCLHIAHDCNLACNYCFAGKGEYQGEKELMSLEVGSVNLALAACTLPHIVKGALEETNLRLFVHRLLSM
jgi:uncharacterized protein